MINVISLGAGKQSTYMMLRALEGSYKHKPDFAIFADLGCEPKYVYEHLYKTRDYVKEKYDFDIVIVSSGNLKEDIEDYIDGKINRVPTIPYRTKHGLLQRQCTYDYKIAPIRKYLQSVRKGEKIRLWIGISLDEIERMKEPNVKYIEHYFPLVESRIRIDAIVQWYRDTGFDEPMKSACLICPFHSDQYWRRFKKVFPDEFEEVCKFDDKIRNYPKLDNKCYLSKHIQPLRDIKFEYEQSLFPEMIEECEGLCGL